MHLTNNNKLERFPYNQHNINDYQLHMQTANVTTNKSPEA